MNDTREKILQEALLLFSKQGYAGVSMSCIAGQLQITKAALYRHYKSKRDIFDAIIKRMEEYDRRRAHDDAVPEVSCDEDPQAYVNIFANRSAGIYGRYFPKFFVFGQTGKGPGKAYGFGILRPYAVFDTGYGSSYFGRRRRKVVTRAFSPVFFDIFSGGEISCVILT